MIIFLVVVYRLVGILLWHICLLKPVGYGLAPAAQGEPDDHPTAQGYHKRRYAHLID